MNGVKISSDQLACKEWLPQPFFDKSDKKKKKKIVKGDIENRSDLAHLDVSLYDYDPIILFKSWYEEAKRSGLVSPHAACLATATRDGEVMARHLLLRRLDEDNGFVMMTDKRSMKSKHLAENPNASLAFLWCYRKENHVEVNRQVRINGGVKELDRCDYIDLFNVQPTYCKVRAHLCHQGETVDDWEDLKTKHDLLHNDVKQGKELDMPEYYTAYKLYPKVMEFYDAAEYQIADRVVFQFKEDGSWSYNRIAA